jgi:four helix bundle protein
MDNQEFAKGLEKRTREFAVQMIRLSASLPNTAEAKVVKHQITKSATSIGANYREANRSRSKADFKNRIDICASEASETQYWLELVIDVQWLSAESIKLAYDECDQLLAIFTSISRKCSSNKRS